jgi:hypothetical protein
VQGRHAQLCMIPISEIPWHILQQGNIRSAGFYAEDGYNRSWPLVWRRALSLIQVSKVKIQRKMTGAGQFLYRPDNCWQ